MMSDVQGLLDDKAFLVTADERKALECFVKGMLEASKRVTDDTTDITIPTTLALPLASVILTGLEALK